MGSEMRRRENIRPAKPVRRFAVWNFFEMSVWQLVIRAVVLNLWVITPKGNLTFLEGTVDYRFFITVHCGIHENEILKQSWWSTMRCCLSSTLIRFHYLIAKTVSVFPLIIFVMNISKCKLSFLYFIVNNWLQAVICYFLKRGNWNP